MGNLFSRFRHLAATEVDLERELEEIIRELNEQNAKEGQLARRDINRHFYALAGFVTLCAILFRVGGVSYHYICIFMLTSITFYWLYRQSQNLLHERQLRNTRRAQADLRARLKNRLDYVSKELKYNEAVGLLARFKVPQQVPPTTAAQPRGPATGALMPRDDRSMVVARRAPAPGASDPVLPPRSHDPLGGFLERTTARMFGISEEQQYALICKRCKRHNGLAIKEEFLFTSFVCKDCGYMNGARKKKQLSPRLPHDYEVEAAVLAHLDSRPPVDEEEEADKDGDAAGPSPQN